MRASFFSACCLSALVAACARPADKVADSSAGAVAASDSATMAAPAPAAAIALSDVAGTWHIVSRPAEGKDTTSTLITLDAKADTSGWTMHYANGKPIAVHVRASGDSVIESAGPYPSARRKGVTVVTNSVFRIRDGKLIGKTVAHYAVKTADSVLVLNTEGTRAP